MQAYTRVAVYSVVAMGDQMGDRRQGRPLAAWRGGVRGVGVTTDA